MKRTMLSRLILAVLAGVAMTASATVAVDGITKTATRPEPAMQAAVYDANQAKAPGHGIVAKNPGGGSGDIVVAVPQTFTAKPWVVGIG